MIIKDANPEHIPVIQDIAERTWWPTYSSIVGAEQLRFMLDRIYGREPLEHVMSSGSQQFIILYDENTPQGFAAYGVRPEDPTVSKLHKIYVLPETHGKGYGRVLIGEVIRRVGTGGIHTLDLNVNRHNKAINFYEHMGFKVLREEDVPIGPYWMNDYVMRLTIKDNEMAGR